MSLRSALQRTKSLSLATLLLTSQLMFAVVAIPQTALAANEIATTDHEGQLKPSGTYSNGNIKTYTELESVNFRFTVDSSTAAQGTIEIIYGSNNGSCAFFQSPFNLGTHDNSADAVVPVDGLPPTVTPVGSPTADGEQWVQVLNVDFASTGKAVVNYYITLTDTAGDCSGSSTHTQFGDTTGGFKTAGAQKVSIPANDIIELASITVTKKVDTDGDGFVDRTATEGEWSFSLDGGASVGTNASGEVVFSNLQTGSYTVTESGPTGYSLIDVTGTNCVFDQANGVATATVTAAPSSIDASCTFVNSLETGSLTISKDSFPDAGQDFSFTSDIPGYETFILDDESDESTDDIPEMITASDLPSGTYTITEDEQAGWYLAAIECSNTTSEVVDLPNRSVTVTVTKDSNIACEFTNRKYGTIKVTKVTDPDSDTSTVFGISAQTLDGEIKDEADRTIKNGETVEYTVKQNGTYSINEDPKEGWVQDDSDCQDIEIKYNNLVAECTIYNHKIPKLTLLKKVINDSGGNASASDFTLLLSGDDYDNEEFTSGSTPEVKYGQEYTVSEKTDEVSGYENKGTECKDDSTGLILDHPITLSPGQQATCTVTNDDITPVLTLVKKVINDYGEAADPTNWLLSATPEVNSIGAETISDNGGFTAQDAYADLEYTLTESLGLSGYLEGAWFCEGVGGLLTGADMNLLKLALGADVTCTITNTADSPELTVVKVVENDPYNGSAEASNFEINVTNTYNGTDSSFDAVEYPGKTIEMNEGPYLVTEVNDSRYETEYSEDCDGVLSTAESAVCIITNTAKPGKINVIKHIDIDGDGIADEEDVDGWQWELAGAEEEVTVYDMGKQNTIEVPRGRYEIREIAQDNFRLSSVECSNSEQIVQVNSITIDVDNGETVNCIFLNEKDAEVKVTKFNDIDRDGRLDEGEAVLSDWQMNLAGEELCEEANVNLERRDDAIDCEPYNYEESQVTGDEDADEGTTTFEGVKPGTIHYLSETTQDNWNWSNTYCEYPENGRIEAQIVAVEDNNFPIYPSAGETIECFVGNYQDVFLLIEKSNNRPSPTVAGDTVTYTLNVSVPENSSTVYDVQVTDLPPENFDVIEGTETASRGSLLENYASPGRWQVGDIAPGESVTLTYRALIEDDVSPGEYPDIAFADGFESENSEVRSVYSNVHLYAEDEETPFVGTNVEVATALGNFGTASVRLANTGSGLLALQILIPLTSIGSVIALDRRQKKGGRA